MVSSRRLSTGVSGRRVGNPLQVANPPHKLAPTVCPLPPAAVHHSPRLAEDKIGAHSLVRYYDTHEPLSKKSLDALLQRASHSHLKRTLTARSLVALGIGAIIGAGLFVERLPRLRKLPGPLSRSHS